MSKDFPVWACLEHYVLYRAMEDGSLESSARKVETEYGLEAGYLGNGLPWQPRAISLLYATLLFPKEYWNLKQDDPTFVEIGKRWSLDGIRIVRQDEMYGNTIYGFIHRMRNALAHANFTFQGEDLEIWNCHSSGREVYRAYIPRSVVLSFLDVVGVLMVNSMQRSTH